MVKFYCDLCGKEYPVESVGFGKLTIDITDSLYPPAHKVEAYDLCQKCAQKFLNPKHLESRL